MTISRERTGAVSIPQLRAVYLVRGLLVGTTFFLAGFLQLEP